MPVPSTAPFVNEGLFRFGGMYGAAWRDGVLLAEVHEVTGQVEITRQDVPLVGQTKMGYKPGRERREGTLRVHKIDSKWEMEVYQYLSQNLSTRRANRDQGKPFLRPFTLLLEVDDPDALGVDKWQLNGVLIWRLPIGFNIGDDLMQREFPITWESEQPIYAFKAVPTATGVPAAQYFPGAGPPSSAA